MKIKRLLKKILGKKTIRVIKYVLAELRYLDARLRNYSGGVYSSCVYKVYGKDDSHVFFGYYDLPQMSNDESKILVHITDKNAQPGRDNAEIAYIDRATGEFHIIAESAAWCWQQGTRLRWNPIDQNCIFFNTYDGNNYCTEEWNIVNSQRVNKYDYALYDISTNLKYGLSLNFSRLQRLRPGYGYSNKIDEFAYSFAPDDDGIFYVDLANNATELLVTLQELAKENSVSSQNSCYINHISISPDSQGFIFFFLWTQGSFSWNNCLYYMDINSRERRCLENRRIVSHYCWKSNEEIIYTSIDGEYFSYKLSDDICTQLENRHLNHDGHPSWLNKNKMIVSDTYPLNKQRQHLFITNERGDRYTELAQLYSDPRLYDEKRCDLHPRVHNDGEYIFVDSTFKNGCRSVVEFYIEDDR